MIENKDQPAFPVLELQHRGDKMMLDLTSPGVSKREYFAAKALQGLLTTSTSAGLTASEFDAIIGDSVALADALLVKLEKTKS